MITDKLVILAGGASSRMKQDVAGNTELTEAQKEQANKRSKSLISIGNSNRPFMDYLLYNAKKAGYKNIYIITGKQNKLFKSFYGDRDKGNRFNGLTINFAIQTIPEGREKPLGTADALYQAMNQYAELKRSPFTICNSDNLYSVNALSLLREFSKTPNALISYDRDSLDFTEDRIAKFALMQFDDQHYLIDIVEKPSLDKVHQFRDKEGKLRVSMNIFKFDGGLFFKYVKDCPIHPIRKEKELPTALLNMINDHPAATRGIPLSEHVPDLTSKDDILTIKRYVETIDLSQW
jgi:glucose-1-phosphate adenylyltransferase